MNFEEIGKKIKELETSFNLEEKITKLQAVQTLLEDLDYKDTRLIALNKEKSLLESSVNEFLHIKKNYQDVKDLSELLAISQDAEISLEVEKLTFVLIELVSDLEVKSIFKHEEDKLNCFLEINAGAGGLDSQDWVVIMARMYGLYFDKKSFQYEIEDKSEGDHSNCIKSIRFSVKGENAFGFLKNETGIHRLVRISPFNAKDKRQTSFAGVFVYPEVNNEIDIKLEEKDLSFETCKSSGAGGQHVNKTESAIRVTHLPTGIAVKCQTSRAQSQNRELALKTLKSKLLAIEMQKKKERDDASLSSKDDISWGNQIRNYVFHPYRLIKDVRSNFSSANIDKILNGDLDEMIKSVLLAKSL